MNFMKNIKTVMLAATIILIVILFGNAIKTVFFPEKPDEPPLFSITVENKSGIDIQGYGITYNLANGEITTEYVGYAGKNIKNGEIFEICFYESIYGSSDPSGFIFSFDVNTSKNNFFTAAEDVSVSPEKGKTYFFVLEKTTGGFALKEG